jgi:hypothetical protein
MENQPSEELLNDYQNSNKTVADRHLCFLELKKRGHIVKYVFFDFIRLKNTFLDCNDIEELALLYKEYTLRDYDMRFLQLDKRDKNVIKEMSEIYRSFP